MQDLFADKADVCFVAQSWVVPVKGVRKVEGRTLSFNFSS